MEKLKEELEAFKAKHANLTDQAWAGFDLAYLGITEILKSHGILPDGDGTGCPPGETFDPTLGKCVPND